MFAIIRVRGIRKLNPKIKKTLEMLNLNRPNHCVVVPETPQYRGMLNVVKDYVTFGQVDEDTIYKLVHKKGRKGRKMLRTLMDEKALKAAVKEIADEKKKLSDVADPVFCLHPPRKGYRNVKMNYPLGALGKRDDISKLINRMV